MNQIIVLAMHGQSPKDFLADEKKEFFRLRSELSHLTGEKFAKVKKRYDELETKMRTWPRTKENDPYFIASHELAEELRRASGSEVIVGFNEFCAPDLSQAIDQAVQHSPSRVCVVTPMMTRGGGHSEMDIPEVVKAAQKRYPDVSIVYVWPFATSEIGKFLADQISQHSQRLSVKI